MGWSEIDDSELAEAIQWDQDQRLLHQSREREAATMKAIRDMERVEFGGDSWSCPNCTLLNHSGSAQCEACGTVNHRKQSTQSSSDSTLGAVAGAVAGGLLGAVTRQGVVSGAVRGGVWGGMIGARFQHNSTEEDHRMQILLGR